MKLHQHHGGGFLTGQAEKKIGEASETRRGQAFVDEILGALNYAGMAVLKELEGALRQNGVDVHLRHSSTLGTQVHLFDGVFAPRPFSQEVLAKAKEIDLGAWSNLDYHSDSNICRRDASIRCAYFMLTGE